VLKPKYDQLVNIHRREDRFSDPPRAAGVEDATFVLVLETTSPS